MDTITLAAEEAARGWGGPVALVVAVAVFSMIAWALETWQSRDHSPPPVSGVIGGGVRVKPQAGRPDTTDDTDGDPTGDTDPDDTDDTDWWGRVVTTRTGVRRVVQVLRTGDHRLPEDDAETVEGMIARLTEQGTAYAEIVRQLQEEFRISESTAKRRIRQARAGGSQAPSDDAGPDDPTGTLAGS